MFVIRLSLLTILLIALAPRGLTAAQPTDWPTDGWQTGFAVLHGIDPALLRAADDRIADALPHVTGLVVVHEGEIVFERYYDDDYGQGNPLNVRSVTKSVIATLIGIALADGTLTGLDQTVGELIPDEIPTGADPAVRDITLEQLLTMTSGLASNAAGEYQRLIASPNWVDLTLGLPVIYPPGEVYSYNSGGSHLLSVILTEVTGQDTTAYADERLFAPLGIERGDWARSPQGEASGGFGLELTPRDMAKLGYLYLNDGVWEGEQLIPVDFARAATSYQSAGDFTGGTPYGYQWWVTSAQGLDAYYALGYGGQYIYVVPALDLIVVIAAGFEQPPGSFGPPRPVIEELIVPAALE